MQQVKKVLWTEGMLLQPQHFQQQERHWMYLLTHHSADFYQSSYGIEELIWDESLLTLGKLAILRCKAVLPDGTYIAIPELMNAPPPVEMPEHCNECVLTIGVPLAIVGQPLVNTKEEKIASYRYQLHYAEIPDDLLSNEKPARIALAQICSQLLWITDSCVGYSNLTLARVIRGKEQPACLLDPNFIPPLRFVSAAPGFIQIIQQILGLLHQRAEAFSAILPDNSTHVSINDLLPRLLLPILRRAFVLLDYLIQRPKTHPEVLYQALLQILGEIAGVVLPDKKSAEIPRYQHADLNATFNAIYIWLREQLAIHFAARAQAIPLQKTPQGTWLVAMPMPALLEASQLILVVSSALPAEALHQQIIPQIKIAPVEYLPKLIRHGLRGFDLDILNIVPQYLPHQAGSAYFTIQKAHPYWQALAHSEAFAIQVSGHFPGLQLNLWAVME